ncbi:hypothetical protein ACLKA6_010301 [Drosophila palustris]
MDEEEIKKDARYTYIDTKPTYSSSVLTGQWINTRCETIPQSKTAIVPCVLLPENVSEKVCERHLTTNQEDYSLEDFEPKLMSRDFIDGRVSKYFNSKTQRASQKFIDAEDYDNNFTSLNMLVYELWPKMLKEKLELASDPSACKKVIQRWKPDRLDAYGNNSSIKRTICKESLCPPPTVYRRDFLPRYPSVPKRAKMKDMIDRIA